jgi:hypothetical protein
MHIHVVMVKVGGSYCVAEKLGDMMSSEKRESRFGSQGDECVFVCGWVKKRSE